jgi:hypothetical protein
LHSRHFLVKVETEYTELSSVNAGLLQGSVLGLLLYLLYTADMPTSPVSTTATFADDTAMTIVAMDRDSADLLAIQNWFKKWRMKTNESKSIHVTFTTRRETCHLVHINNVQLPQEDVKYLGLHIDRRITCHKHILLGRKSNLYTSNKLFIYKAILKSIRTYGIQLWGKVSTSNIDILERFQSKALHMIVDALWYVPNTVIRRDLQYQQLKKKSAATALNTVLT